jgi:hypothetical protein
MSDGVFVAALTVNVLTSTGWIGSVEPTTQRACVGVAAAGGSDRSVGAAAGLSRAGMLIALAMA